MRNRIWQVSSYIYRLWTGPLFQTLHYCVKMTMIPYTQILKMYEYFRYLMTCIGLKSIISWRACIRYRCTFFLNGRKQFVQWCDYITLQVTLHAANKLFPSTQSDGLFMCSQSGKQIHVILILIHVCFHILMVYTLTVTYMPTLYFRLVKKRYSSCKMFGLIHL